ncbi:MAG: hypothetical protein DHS20C18_29550 [Saprospiraceae bacterium]|nr:MAG: hypothetical protein DHS20C18_29550 [Saprospiraceae bacterium]
MQLKKLTFTLLAIIFISGAGFAQSAKLQQKATDKVEELNTQITSVNPDIALTAEQKERLTELYIEKLKGTRKMKKDGEEKDAIKAFNKENWGKIKAVLTKEQFRARKKAKATKVDD